MSTPTSRIFRDWLGHLCRHRRTIPNAIRPGGGRYRTRTDDLLVVNQLL